MQGVEYKDTFASKGSDLYKALTELKGKEREKTAEKIYKETTVRMVACYGHNWKDFWK